LLSGTQVVIKRCQGRLRVDSGGSPAFEALGIRIEETRALWRKFAYPCLDWSERRPYTGGSPGAAVLKMAVKKKWVTRELDSSALYGTTFGLREMRARFGFNP
jgi:hypothetical protein